MIGGRVLDTSALVDFTTGKSVYAQAVVWVSVEQSIVLAVPAAALTAAWAAVPAGTHDVLEVLLNLPVTVVDPLDTEAARQTGLLLAAVTEPVEVPVATAHVAWSGRRRGWPVLTAEPAPLRAIAPDVEIETLP